jgi:hypothetical protein
MPANKRFAGMARSYICCFNANWNYLRFIAASIC